MQLPPYILSSASDEGWSSGRIRATLVLHGKNSTKKNTTRRSGSGRRRRRRSRRSRRSIRRRVETGMEMKRCSDGKRRG
jgi:hypothetical protein